MAKLEVQLLGLRFPSPIMSASGPHTDGVDSIAKAVSGGAGGIVAQTVLPEPYRNGPQPDTVPYGRDGLLTCQRGSTRSASEWVYPTDAGVPVIASLGGKVAAEVAELGARLVASGAQALEYATAFASWPEAVEALKALRRTVSVPILAKMNLRHGEDIADRALEIEPYVDAFTCMGGFGPVLDVDVDTDPGAPRLGDPYGYGWLSGAPVHPIAVRTVFEVARKVKKPVIACGGAMTVRDVVEFLEVGASLVQVATLPILKGPSVYGTLTADLGNWMDEHGYADVAALQGVYLRRFGHGQRVVLTFEEAPQLEPAKCTGCTICGLVCYYGAITARSKELPVIDAAKCFECGLCVSACPDGALSFRPREQVTMLPSRR
jgi:dihydroorotate dehydrogenase/NAD-dependent dihydropyrimidine dehydrogenase PreA subunit